MIDGRQRAYEVVRPEPLPAPWIGAHLYYQGELDLLVRELVVPLLRDLRESGLLARHFFLRYWQGGPHLRLRLLPADSDAAWAVRHAVQGAASRVFASHASPSRVTPKLYAEVAEALRRLEPDVEACSLEPNNSLRFVDYHAEHRKYGRGAALEAVERHFELSSELAERLVCREAPVRGRPALALAALIAATAADGPELRELAVRLESGRRGLGGFLGLADHEEARVAQVYCSQRERLTTIALKMWKHQKAQTGEVVLDAWAESVADLWRRLADMERAGTFTLPGDGRGPRPGMSATAFAVDNCSHLFFNRLGISVADECFVRGLAAHTVRALLGRRQGQGA